jgi:hypothetical protein
MSDLWVMDNLGDGMARDSKSRASDEHGILFALWKIAYKASFDK